MYFYLLKNGLYFAIPPANLIKVKILVSFENMCNFLTSNMKGKEKTGDIVSQLLHLGTHIIVTINLQLVHL